MSDLKAQELQMSRELAHAKRGLGWGVLSGATWGLDGVILGMALALAPFTNSTSLYLAPLVSAALHDGFAAVWLLIYNFLNGKASEYLRTLSTKPGLMVILAACFGGPIAMSGYLLGINMAGASYALAITAMYPAVGAILAVFILKERITPRVWLGIILCILGAIIVGYTPPEGNYPNFYLGLAFALLATFGWGMEGVLSTFGMDMIDPDIAIGIREGFSFLAYLILVIPIIKGFPMFVATFSENSIYYLILAGFLGALSYLAWYKALNMTGVGRAMALNITYALWAVFFGAILTDLKITPTLLGGAIIITIGTLLVTANPKELLNLRAR
ncbi:DMT family transporter [Carboxydothermus ferrireducens]|uniref:Drug/metabolite transporter (DMT)-like permease n=1 Tax=Carboxydothermus ferrireducens DSM 11255 TaxID=1119529 RepID=A0ABX2RBG8_9THEO|nr:DMT family transporter [Carboxydothermus ferrireducens]NYE58516.1 drug/metabolite transporter (DMT)-like permease [Carboxydothermus ferrireducens DSM 11255]